MKGTLYGVSVGPGDPELMTIKAVKVLNACPVWAAPETTGGGTLALSIARQGADSEGKEILRLPFTMSHDRVVREESYDRLARKVMDALDRGCNVAMLSLGDLSIYSTFWHLAPRVMAAGYSVEAVAGVPSFCAVAAVLGQSLTQGMDEPLSILPARGRLDEQLLLPGAKVLMKTGSSLNQVKQALRRAGLYEHASMVINCGLPDERVLRSLDDAGGEAGYFATILVKERE